jgi:hypothetical protein
MNKSDSQRTTLRLTMVMALMDRDLPADSLIEQAEVLVDYVLQDAGEDDKVGDVTHLRPV